MSRNIFKRIAGATPYRKPERIPHMVNLLLAVWAQEGMTDQRMGQLLVNAARLGGWSANDIFNCEDEIFAKGFLEMLQDDVEIKR